MCGSIMHILYVRLLWTTLLQKKHCQSVIHSEWLWNSPVEKRIGVPSLIFCTVLIHLDVHSPRIISISQYAINRTHRTSV